MVKAKGKTPTKRKPGPKPARTARRLRIAAAKIQGRTIQEIAKQEAVSCSWASREANDPETRQILMTLLNQERAWVSRVFVKTLTAIEEALAAMQGGVTSLGVVYTIGPDHYARLSAADRFRKLLTAGRPIPKPSEGSQSSRQAVTWEDFARLIAASRGAPACPPENSQKAKEP